MYEIKREIQKYLLEWRTNVNHKVLFLCGARRIGKTTETKKFANESYEQIIYIDLNNDEFSFVDTVIKAGVGMFTMLDYCDKAGLPQYEDSKKTVLILDEIQKSKIVYNSIRVLKKELNCDIIVICDNIVETYGYFQPAGTMEYLTMLPLSFREFCSIYSAEKLLACGKEDERLFGLYDVYKQIGGYPEAVKCYIKTKSIDKCYTVIYDVLNTIRNEYRADTREELIFEDIFSKKNNRAINWLRNNKILGICGVYTAEDKGIANSGGFYFLDCGIANLIGKKTNIAENYVFSELNRLYTVPYNEKSVLGNYPCVKADKGEFVVIDNAERVYGISLDTSDKEARFIGVALPNNKKVLKIPIFAIGTGFPYSF